MPMLAPEQAELDALDPETRASAWAMARRLAHEAGALTEVTVESMRAALDAAGGTRNPAPSRGVEQR